MKPRIFWRTLLACLVAGAVTAPAQTPGPQRPPPGDFDGPPVNRGPGGPGGPGGFGGPPNGVRENRQLTKQFDKNGDRHLDAAERKAARAFLATEIAEGLSPQFRQPPPRRNDNPEPVSPGPRVAVKDAKSFPDAPLYASNVVRTIFLEFENADWEKELADFHGTDVEVPAKLTVDGRVYPDVGVHFRGASSYKMVKEGHKRSFNLSMDLVHEDQRLGGYRTLDLLNSHEDPTFLRTVLASFVARQYIPAPKANFVRVVINGESRGLYVNAQQFNKDFIMENFGTTKGARWKVPGSPRGRGSRAYLGDDAAPYKKIYDIKSKDDSKPWKDLIRLCKVLNETPAGQLEQALAPLLDIDGALKFLAVDNALINDDGYWIRTSDYNLYEDEKGRFHLIPHDINETFSLPGGPGFGGPGGPGGPRNFRGPGNPDGPERPGGRRGGPGGGGDDGLKVDGVKLDPLVAANDSAKPLLSKLLAVPALRTRYLGYVRDVAQRWLDWKTLGPVVAQYQSLISEEVKMDTRKLASFDAFQKGIHGESAAPGTNSPGADRSISLRSFAEQRRAYLLKVTDK